MNLILFCLTAMQLWRQRRESRRVFSGTNSRVQGQKDMDQIRMYLKLFLIMAITSVTLIINIIALFLAFGTNFYTIQKILFTLYYLRGPLIFWCCIWSRENVRNAFLGAFTCHRKRPEVQQTASMDLSLMDTSISVTNASGDTPLYISNMVQNAPELKLSS
jgi:hypothetical protein